MSVLVSSLQRLFAWKVRGVRWVEIAGVLLVAVMVFSVYVAKAAAARTGSEIADLERQIADNGRRVRLLRAEVARLERPARLEALSRDAGLVPVDVRRLATAETLPAIAPQPSRQTSAASAAADQSPVVQAPAAPPPSPAAASSGSPAAESAETAQ